MDHIPNSGADGEHATSTGCVILAIDPGLAGAIAVLGADGSLLDVQDMPCLADGAKGRRTVNAPLLAQIVVASRASVAFCEFVGPRPGELSR